ncbi:MAG: hypothetical protein GXY74_09650 [Phycisphaerae bacterium]|nr:hypothetical protein [Phycisphaerae bacterium]
MRMMSVSLAVVLVSLVEVSMPAAEGDSSSSRPDPSAASTSPTAAAPKAAENATPPSSVPAPPDAAVVTVDQPTHAVRRTLFAATVENETGQEQYKPVAAGIGDLVGVFLSRQEQLTIVERYKLDALAREQAMSLKGLTGQEHAVAAGRLLEADTVLVGRLFMQDRKLIVSLKALEIATARVVAADQVACRPEDMMEAALQLARNLAEQMATPLPPIDPGAVDKSPIAGLHFAQALSHYYAGDMDSAIMQLMRTIDLDPDYVEVHYWTGMCHWRLKEWPHAVIEWEKYLKRRPWSEHAAEIAPLLEKARQLDKESAIPRLAPEAEEGATPQEQPTHGSKG